METALQLLLDLHNNWCQFWNHEEKKTASNGYIRRLLQNGAVLLNGQKATEKTIVEYPITELVLYPKSLNKRITLV